MKSIIHLYNKILPCSSNGLAFELQFLHCFPDINGIILTSVEPINTGGLSPCQHRGSVPLCPVPLCPEIDVGMAAWRQDFLRPITLPYSPITHPYFQIRNGYSPQSEKPVDLRVSVSRFVYNTGQHRGSVPLCPILGLIPASLIHVSSVSSLYIT